ncbi:hypothetical protein [Pseudoalteromonas tetraodonis]|uniref:hypothetical protein n=1 Tax=Pseudoalteromonas tetraodonis TaxID=43659 RepID=UPI003A97F646
MTMEATISERIDKTTYKEGDVSESGNTIKIIRCVTSDVIVFESTDGSTIWEYRNRDGAIADKASIKFAEINEMLPSGIDEEIESKLHISLCNVFFSAINAETLEECEKCFDVIEKRIKNFKTPYQIKSMYIFCTIIFTVIISAALVVIYNYSNISFKSVFICIATGAIGALFSILQRNDEIKLDIRIPNNYIYLQSMFTVLLGSISGGIIYLLAMSDLAFSFASENIHSLAILSIMSGFSERMIPELFNKIDKSN